MSVSQALRRLRRVLDLEEEQSKLALDSAMGQLRQLERFSTEADNQARAGRELIVSSAQTGELTDRLAGLEEERAAVRRSAALVHQIEAAQSDAERLRQEFLTKRVESRQVETLIHEAEADDAIDAGRRSQQSLDDWYLNRLHSVTPVPGSDRSDTPVLPGKVKHPSLKEQSASTASRSNASPETSTLIPNRENHS